MNPSTSESTHEDLEKLHDHGFGRAVKGFRTFSAAADFSSRWSSLEPDQIRELYPRRTRGMGDTEVRILRHQVSNDLRRQGIEGLLNFFGGSLESVERVAKAVLEAGSGGFGARSSATSAASLGQAIALDIYIFGTGPTGVPDFDEFVEYRREKAELQRINEQLGTD